VVVTHPIAPRDNLALARLLGGVFCREQEAAAWCADFEAEYARLRAMPPAPPRTVLYCIWQDPWMTVSGDTYIARMLAEIGWQLPELQGYAIRYPNSAGRPELLAQIDGVLLSSEPYRFTKPMRPCWSADRQAGAAGRWGDDVVVWQPFAAGLAVFAGAGGR
jgi:hypothetical protein